MKSNIRFLLIIIFTTIAAGTLDFLLIIDVNTIFYYTLLGGIIRLISEVIFNSMEKSAPNKG